MQLYPVARWFTSSLIASVEQAASQLWASVVQLRLRMIQSKWIQNRNPSILEIGYKKEKTEVVS